MTGTGALLDKCKAAFRLFDKDDDGTITTHEIGVVMRSLGKHPTDEELKKIVDEIDIDGDGRVTFDEFLTIMTKQFCSKETARDIREAFRVFDKDGKGYLTVSEFRHIMENLGEKMTWEETEEMIEMVDTDGDDKISCDDFIKKVTTTE
ncbi:neo-calmodulin-like [Mytilus californianus]|uniref:neo-calmodulin-like n=2 Tax=Mytilus californianus TaxID=6549 RepID=UPI00224650A5|nr:neo-calmodulin-like [Mytilus californianus]